MQSSLNEQSLLNQATTAIELEGPQIENESTNDPFWFHSSFLGTMEMYADAQRVANYLDLHAGWFRRCADPMTVESLGNNSYALTLGHYGSMGHYIEPKIGLELFPQQDRVYRIETIPIPDYSPPGYEVDFKAIQTLVEEQVEKAGDSASVTRVEWELQLGVGVYFPKFVRAVSPALIQKTGDRLIAQIVKQISRRLTRKVQEDFHSQQGTEALKNFRQLYKKRPSFCCQQK